MEKSDKVSIGALVLCVVGLALIITLIAWSPGKLANIIPAGISQSAAVAGALLSSSDFAILANTYTDTTAGTVVNDGDVGYTTPPATPPTINGGTTHVADGVYSLAGTDQGSALSGLNAQACDFNFGSPTDLSLLSQPLAPGVYCITGATSIGTGGITLSGAGGVFIFRVAGALTSVDNSVVTLSGIAARDVFWTPSSATTLGANTVFAGTVIDDADITVGANSTWIGRALAFGGTITTDTDTITLPPPPAPAVLNVIKLVVNTSGGTAVATDFNIHVKSATSSADVFGSPVLGTSTPGTLYTLSPGTYNVSEDANAQYTQTFSVVDCDSSGNVTLAEGQNKTCTIINTDIPPVAPAPATSGGGGGGSGSVATVAVPLIGILKVPTPLALSGSGSVTYNYTVWNVAKLTALVNVTVTDDKCGPLTLISGDLDGDAKLDIAENWNYRCTTTLSTTTTNTSVATGYSDDPLHQIAVATSIATVVVGAAPGFPNTGLIAPLINIVKVPSRLTPFPFGGGNVTYTYTVTNPGVVSMNNVLVTDDKCSQVFRTSIDGNGNNLLDPGESWTYNCQSNISISTRNVATARGSANGFTAIGYAFATVLVTAPGLPNTGFPPEGISLDTMMLAATLILVLLILVVVLKRRTI